MMGTTQQGIFSEPLTLLAEHPLIAALALIFFLLVQGLGILKVIRIGGACFVVVVREFKHEISGGLKIAAELKREFTTWKTDE